MQPSRSLVEDPALFDKYFPEVQYATMISLLNQEGLYNASPGDECIICIEEFLPEDTVRVLYCQHYFHSACLAEWFKKNKNCPYCRAEHSADSLPRLLAELNLSGSKDAQALAAAIFRKNSTARILQKEHVE